MVTTRTPISRAGKLRVSPRAIEVFRAMQSLETQCPDLLSSGHYDCAICEQWWDLHSILHDEVAPLPPWEWPIIEKPEEDYEPGDPATDARARYVMLDEAAALAEGCNQIN